MNFRQDTHILVSTLQESHLFRLAPSRIARVSSSSTTIVTTEPTLAFGNVALRTLQGGKSTYTDSSFVVQVTKSGVGLFEYDTALGEYSARGQRWTPEKQGDGWSGREIVAADVNPSQFVVALKGGRLAILNLNDRAELKLVK